MPKTSRSSGQQEIKQLNHHCCCLQINGSGILIEGPSGCGKTSLMIRLLEASTRRGIDCAFVSDDQVYLETKDDELIAVAPEPIAGNIELYGHGIIRAEYLPSTTVSLVCELVDANQIERLPEPESTKRDGVSLNIIKLPQHHELWSQRLLFAHLNLPLWGKGVSDNVPIG